MTPPPIRRIGVELPEWLLARLDRQAELTNTSRAKMIEAAVHGLVREFEQIDAEEGIACPECGGTTDVDDFPDGRHRVCRSCTWRYAEPAVLAGAR